MLTIRMQRKGRSGHAQFRVVVQDSRFHPSSGRVVAYVGNYDPHIKAAKLDSEKISKYLTNGAQPSERVAKLLSKEGIKLPDWFTPAVPKKGGVRNPDKRRSTRPAGEPAPLPAQTSPDEVLAGEPKAEATEESAAEAVAEKTEPVEAPTQEVPEPAPAEESPAETLVEAEPTEAPAEKPQT